MELTNDIIDMTYKFAWTFLKRKNRTDIDHNDLAHDVLLKLTKAAEVEPRYLRHKVWLDVKCVFLDFYTNFTTRKNNVMLEAVHAEFDMKTTDPDTTEAIDEFSKAFEIVYAGNHTLAEIIKMMLNGMTVAEIAKIRDTSTQAVNELRQRARKAFATALGIANEVAA